ncbi:MAG: response regulator transcription factor [Thermomicrobiales bacterium]
MAMTVLIVDDDRELVEVLSEALLEAGYSVRVAWDGQMALEAVGKVHTDLVIADVRMPRLDGVGLMRALRARAAPVPVVLMSAWPGMADDDRITMLAKPFGLDEMLGVVAATIAGR